jgi:hypothetical protein
MGDMCSVNRFLAEDMTNPCAVAKFQALSASFYECLRKSASLENKGFERENFF